MLIAQLACANDLARSPAGSHTPMCYERRPAMVRRVARARAASARGRRARPSCPGCSRWPGARLTAPPGGSLERRWRGRRTTGAGPSAGPVEDHHRDAPGGAPLVVGEHRQLGGHLGVEPVALVPLRDPPPDLEPLRPHLDRGRGTREEVVVPRG